ncbi:helix-turn-helix resolvase-like protein [Primorskyibacter sedentarius]|uniref:Helix-turn-helix resolvase-like protein n=1 Tax=Primorskyibacter sedentarius TaxID=745311 RepID=A0A4R3IYU4_9RHOB|nr:helix-turn-helix resolvase-like protein [Primorskyibacter sedentarius]
MEFLSVIRRWALRDKMPIREIARRTGLSRNTIKKYLREGAVEPKFKTPKRPSKLAPYADRLSAWLLIQTRKSRKERRALKQMHADLVWLGCPRVSVKSYLKRRRITELGIAFAMGTHRVTKFNKWPLSGVLRVDHSPQGNLFCRSYGPLRPDNALETNGCLRPAPGCGIRSS